MPMTVKEMGLPWKRGGPSAKVAAIKWLNVISSALFWV
jgi:hypothetical protein